jgi:hypothetical protein
LASLLIIFQFQTRFLGGPPPGERESMPFLVKTRYGETVKYADDAGIHAVV